MAEINQISEAEHIRIEAFVEFAEKALDSDDLPGLLQMAVANVSKGLDASHSKVLRWTEDNELLVQAGLGWKEGVVGHATLEADLGSPAGYALKTALPVRSRDFTNESRFRIPDLLAEHGIKSAVNVLIDGEERPYGVLEVDSQKAQDFTQADTVFLQGYAKLLSRAIIRVRKSTDLFKKSELSDLQFRELNHRIGNDLQLVTSLIRYRARQPKSKEAKTELNWIATRILALSQLHNELRRLKSTSEIDLGPYVTGLCNKLSEVHTLSQTDIDLECETESWMVRSQDAASVGLIINEFVSNSIEHAFPNFSGTISIALLEEGQDMVLTMKDDGVGYDGDVPSSRSGIGLMESLAKSVSDDIAVTTKDGVTVKIALRQMAAAKEEEE